ncbi:MAG: hypothetical protein ACRC6T_09770 [Sarcina sp.]
MKLMFINYAKLDDIDKEYYSNEIKLKKDIMKNKMNFIRKKYGNVGKYFDELEVGDLVE